MDASARQLDHLLELEARHDDLLRRLDELDRRVSSVLTECLPHREGHEGAGNGSAGAR